MQDWTATNTEVSRPLFSKMYDEIDVPTNAISVAGKSHQRDQVIRLYWMRATNND
jgi:hypothetical protein